MATDLKEENQELRRSLFRAIGHQRIAERELEEERRISAQLRNQLEVTQRRLEMALGT